MMNGHIEVYSVLGKGTKFWFEIETTAVLAVAKERLQAVPPLNHFSTVPPETKILVAEDNPVNQLVIEAVLNNLGLEPEIVTNGIEALKRIKSTHIDLVLMDCHMPEMDGFETTRKIRSLSGEVKDVPIIALSASALDADRNACMDAGMDDFLSKPVQPDTLEKMISKYVVEQSLQRV
jgi:CheY-like chemotaxis protein